MIPELDDLALAVIAAYDVLMRGDGASIITRRITADNLTDAFMAYLSSH